MKKVSVITVNFNQHSVTEAFLDSVAANENLDELQVIVVDNGSSINHVPKWINQYPSVNFMRSEINLGFAGGNNLALTKAEGHYLFFVNNDTELTSGLVEKLVSILDRHPGVGMVSPKIRYYDKPNMIQYAGFTPMNFYTCRNKCIGQFEDDKGQYDSATGQTGYIHGAAMMVRRTAIEKAGPMAENFFLYFEEIDWCERIKRAGFELWIEPRALIYHKESVSVGNKSALKEYFMNRNRILFIRKNAPFLAKIIFTLHFCLLVTPRNVINYISQKRSDLIPWLFKAMWWNLKNSTDSINSGFPINKI